MKKYFAGRKKTPNGKEKLTDTKDGKNENIWKLYDKLNTENCVK